MALITGGLNTDRFDATSAVVEQDAHVATDFLQSRGLAKLPDNLGDYKLSALDAEELAGRFAPFAYKFYPLSTSDLIANGAVRSREFCNHRGLRYGQNPTETNSSVLDEIEKRTTEEGG